MNGERNPNREFSEEVRREERTAAGNACRICGKSGKKEWLQHAHIYTLSQHPKWERAGSDKRKWNSDKYVSSVNNCVALCQTHHGKIDSKVGLQKVTVQYLELLKINQNQCTALIGPIEGDWHRCGCKLRKGSYRCGHHSKGGNEETLVARKGGWKAKSAPKSKVKPKPSPKRKPKAKTKPNAKVKASPKGNPKANPISKSKPKPKPKTRIVRRSNNEGCKIT